MRTISSVSSNGVVKQNIDAKREGYGMKNWFIVLLLSMVYTASLHADSALFLDNVLTIDDAIVVEGDSTRYYQRVRLGIQSNGDFKVIDAEEKNLAYIEEWSLGVFYTEPVSVELNVIGYLSTPCTELNTAITRRDNTFFVAVGETPLQTLVPCAQVIHPFDIMLELDVADLPAGDYLVVLNGDSTDFTLE